MYTVYCIHIYIEIIYIYIHTRTRTRTRTRIRIRIRIRIGIGICICICIYTEQVIKGIMFFFLHMPHKVHKTQQSSKAAFFLPKSQHLLSLSIYIHKHVNIFIIWTCHDGDMIIGEGSALTPPVVWGVILVF